MAKVLIIARVMPESPETDLESIKQEAQAFLKSEGALQVSFEEIPIAFSLKALMVKTDFPEEKGTDIVEEKLTSIKGVSSVKIEDYRRAFG